MLPKLCQTRTSLTIKEQTNLLKEPNRLKLTILSDIVQVIHKVDERGYELYNPPTVLPSKIILSIFLFLIALVS